MKEFFAEIFVAVLVFGILSASIGRDEPGEAAPGVARPPAVAESSTHAETEQARKSRAEQIPLPLPHPERG